MLVQLINADRCMYNTEKHLKKKRIRTDAVKPNARSEKSC